MLAGEGRVIGVWGNDAWCARLSGAKGVVCR